MDIKQQPTPQELSLNANLDTTPILYTDNIMMTSNEDGLVLDICQKFGASNQFRIVSRIGMSKNHAKRFLNELGKLLAKTEGLIQTGGKPMD